MTSIPANFLATGTGAQLGCPAATGESAEGAFAALLGLGGSAATSELIDATALQPLLQSPAIAALPPDVVQRLTELLEGGQPISAEDLAEAVGEDADGTTLPDVIAGLLQALPQQINLPGDHEQEASGEADTSTAPTTGDALPPPIAPLANGDGVATQPEEAVVSPKTGAQPHPIAPQAQQLPADANAAEPAETADLGKPVDSAAKATQSAAATADTETADAPPDGAKISAATQAQPRPDQRKPEQAGERPHELHAEGDKPKTTEKPKAASAHASSTGLERAASRAAEQAQDRIASNLEHRALIASHEGHVNNADDTTVDGPSLGTPQNALDAARGLRLAALTGTNGQAQLPIAQLAVQIAAQARAGANRFSIRLDPPELGKIDIRLDVSHDGSVASRLSVERPETLDMLLRDAKALERALNDAGLKTDEGSLRFSLKGEGFGQSQQQNMQQQSRRRDADQLAAIEAMNEGAALADVRRYLATTALDIVV